MDEIKLKVDELMTLLNKLSYKEIIASKQELRDELGKLGVFLSDFQRLINLPKKPLEMDSSNYPSKESYGDDIIKLLRDNPGYYSSEQIGYCIGAKKEAIVHVLRKLELEHVLTKIVNPKNKIERLWRIAKK
jgi:hypothetical protein